jgi:hypothetical protein
LISKARDRRLAYRRMNISYTEIEQSGPPVAPLGFPAPHGKIFSFLFCKGEIDMIPLIV